MKKPRQRAMEHMLRSLGMRRLFEAPAEAEGRRVEVTRWTGRDDRQLIGALTSEDGEFVFRYVPGYEGSAISAFPDKERDYRSPILWPFFQVRLPPTGRQDVKAFIEKKKIDVNDPFEMLGTLGRLSVTNPYELKLVGEGRA